MLLKRFNVIKEVSEQPKINAMLKDGWEKVEVPKPGTPPKTPEKTDTPPKQ